MNTQILVNYFGSVKKAADAFGVSVQAFYKWGREGVPPVRQEQAERLTKGKIKASVRAVDALMAQ
jgi:hypothetical protein